MRTRRERIAFGFVVWCSLALAWALLDPPMAHAEISFVDLFHSGLYSQTGNGNTVTPGGYRFDTRLFSVNPDDFTSATLEYPGAASPALLTPVDNKTLAFGSPLFATQSEMDLAFPTGAYSYAAMGPANDTTSVNYTADVYPQSLPYLDGATYASLQGMNPTHPFQVHFSPFVTGPGADASFIFFTLFDTTAGTFVLDAGFLPSTTADFTIPANTLTAEHDYVYEMIFSNRVTAESPGAEFPAQLGFDFRTTGTFTALVPEPGSLSILALAGVALLRRRRRA